MFKKKKAKKTSSKKTGLDSKGKLKKGYYFKKGGGIAKAKKTK